MCSKRGRGHRPPRRAPYLGLSRWNGLHNVVCGKKEEGVLPAPSPVIDPESNVLRTWGREEVGGMGGSACAGREYRDWGRDRGSTSLRPSLTPTPTPSADPFSFSCPVLLRPPPLRLFSFSPPLRSPLAGAAKVCASAFKDPAMDFSHTASSSRSDTIQDGDLYVAFCRDVSRAALCAPRPPRAGSKPRARPRRGAGR